MDGAVISTVPSFYTEVLMKSPVFHSPNPCHDIALLEPVTREAVAKVIAVAQSAGVTLQVLETYRSQERQRQLFAQGATQLQTVGVHHYGLAADLGIVIGGQVNWKADYQVLGAWAKAAGLVWGGNWSTFKDMDHVQRIAVADQARLFNGSWYPEPAYIAPQVG